MYTIKNLRDVRDAAPDAGVGATSRRCGSRRAI